MMNHAMHRTRAIVAAGFLLLGLPSAAIGDPPARLPNVLPRDETGATRFRERFPQFDGRGVIVAVFDSGIDPGAPGLQVTSHGLPKIIDMLDGTGSGDVDTSTVVREAGGKIIGLSGRTLQLPDEWLGADREFHIGLKRGFDFFSSNLIERLKKERRERFDRQQQQAEAELRRELAAVENSAADGDAGDRNGGKPAGPGRVELQQRLDQLIAAAEDFDDSGPVFDCVVFCEGTRWHAVVDTDEDGELADERLLTDFRVNRDTATFGGGADLNFAVNIYDEGRRLSIVADGDPHGTHMAGIIAGHDPERPEFDGLAPGAQIVSVKIGDPRLGGMETGNAILRGLQAVVDHRCDLVNIGFGQPASAPGRGQLMRWIGELADRHQVLLVAAVGDQGPALSTVTAPGGGSAAVLGVGAYVSPAMARAQYRQHGSPTGNPYTWSSRGPALDGHLGVDVFAPGGAFAAVPHWTINRSMQMDGTSMASPNACGAIALLLSAAKARELPHTPRAVRQALENTARPLEGISPLAQGRGLIAVDRAFDYLERHPARDFEETRFRIRLPRRGDARGIYLREPHEVGKVADHLVRIQPEFTRPVENEVQRNFQVTVRLEATADWVETGDFLLLASGGGSLDVRVDSRSLPPGVHHAAVIGRDGDCEEGVELFRIPVTVIKPEVPAGDASSIRRQSAISRGEIQRHLIAVPDGAAWAEWKIRRTDNGPSHTFVAHVVQLLEGESFEAAQRHRHLRLGGGDRQTFRFAVHAGRTAEFCLAMNWAAAGTAELESEIHFYGPAIRWSEPPFVPGGQSARLHVANAFGRRAFSTEAVLDTVRQVVLPSEVQRRPGNPQRDRLPDGRVLDELLLTYRIASDADREATLSFPLSDDLLYESPLAGRFWMLFDAVKRRTAAGDVAPKQVELAEGQYTLRLQLRHEQRAMLDRFERMPLCIDWPLESPLELKIFADRATAAAGDPADAIERLKLERGERTALIVAGPPPQAVAELSGEYHALLGHVRLTPAGIDSDETDFAPRLPIVWSALEPNAALSDDFTGADHDIAGARHPGNFANEIRDLRVQQLRSLASEETAATFEKLAQKLLRRDPNHLPILIARLHRLDDDQHRKQRLPQVVAAADAVLARIDQAELARYFGQRHSADDSPDRNAAKRMEDQRDALIDALYRKGRALGYMELPDVLAKHPIRDPAAHDRAFEDNFAELQRWIDPADQRVYLLTVRWHRRKQRYGAALEVLAKHVNNQPPEFWPHKKRRDIYQSLGWHHLSAAEDRWLLIRFPASFEPF